MERQRLAELSQDVARLGKLLESLREPGADDQPTRDAALVEVRALAKSLLGPSRSIDVDRAQWLAELLAHSPDVISIVDREGRLLYLSRTATDRSPSELVGSLASNYVPPSHRAAWDGALGRAIATGEPQHVEIYSVGDFWWDTRLAPIRGDNGVDVVLTIGTDITARKRAEAELGRREEELGLVLDASGMGLWRWNLARDEVSWDAASRRLFAWPMDTGTIPFEDVLGRIHSDDRNRIREHTRNTVTTGVYRDVECRLSLPDGTEKWVMSKGKVLRGPDGRVTEIVGGLVDITATRNALLHARRAEKLEAIGLLAGGVAHDFNNLLTVILASLDLARRTDDPSRQASLLTDATSAAKRASELTRQLLAFGRRQQVIDTRLDLNSTLEDMLRLLRRLLPETIDIEFSSTDDLPPTQGDRGQIEQLVTNLCVNARDAMPHGGRLTIRTQVSEIDQSFLELHPWGRTGRFVHLSVSDTGMGIGRDILDRIFEPFFSTKEQGTGLGLATVYGIVKRHRGMVLASSEPGKGTTFDVYLPTAEGGRREVPSQPSDAPRGGTETLLVAEDESATQNVVVSILRGAGYRVVTASDGAEAVERFRNMPNEIDLVLLDAVMPKKNGREALVEIRALSPDVPAILSSGYSDSLGEDPTAAPGVRFLPKPYQPDDLLRAVRRALADRSRKAPSARPGSED